MLKLILLAAAIVGFTGCGDDDDETTADTNHSCSIAVDGLGKDIACISYTNLPSTSVTDATTACTDSYAGDAGNTGTFSDSVVCATTNTLGTCTLSGDSLGGASAATITYYNIDSDFTATEAEAGCTGSSGGTWTAATALR